jgi:hypothetical protein
MPSHNADAPKQIAIGTSSRKLVTRARMPRMTRMPVAMILTIGSGDPVGQRGI